MPAKRRARKRMTEEQLRECERLSAVGCTHAQMAGFLGVSEPQFTALLDNTSEARERITKAKIAATARVANSLFRRATEDADVAAQRFWLQSQGGPAWQPNTPQTSVTVNLSAALKDISKVIDGNASETGHKPPIDVNPARGFIESDQSLSDETQAERDLVSGNSNDWYLTRDVVRAIDAMVSDDDP